ncbi:hypothetical protein [Fibrella musci]|uniref:hypothetical protein n=1 Tax=Fibrella musci TaxID=3242485 RepID=UPI0035213463
MAPHLGFATCQFIKATQHHLLPRPDRFVWKQNSRLTVSRVYFLSASLLLYGLTVRTCFGLW